MIAIGDLKFKGYITLYLPELGSGISAGGGWYFSEFLFDTPGLLLFSDSIVLLLTVGLEFYLQHF